MDVPVADLIFRFKHGDIRTVEMFLNGGWFGPSDNCDPENVDPFVNIGFKPLPDSQASVPGFDFSRGSLSLPAGVILAFFGLAQHHDTWYGDYLYIGNNLASRGVLPDS